MNVNSNGDQENGDENEVDDGMDENGGSTGLHIPQLHYPAVPWQLKQKPRRQQDEEQHRHHNRSPIYHLSLAFSYSCDDIPCSLFVDWICLLSVTGDQIERRQRHL
ncbi:hypothetical protein Droror1_Dr00021774 [Drosera rotundifolia]